MCSFFNSVLYLTMEYNITFKYVKSNPLPLDNLIHYNFNEKIHYFWIIFLTLFVFRTLGYRAIFFFCVLTLFSNKFNSILLQTP